MKKVLIGIGVFVVVLVAALLIIPPLIPVDVYKEQLTSQVRDATGRELVIKGDMSFSLLPSVGIEANDVAFANARGASTPQMATLKRLTVALRVLPLLSGEVEVDSFVLVEPVINLEVDKEGRPNWEFKAKPTAQAAPASGERAEAGDGAGGDLGIADIRLGDVRLVDGTVNYFDAQSGQKEQIEKVNLTVSLPALDQPFDAKGTATWHDKEVALTLHAANLKDLLAGKSTTVRLGVDSEPVDLAFEGSVVNGARLQAEGDTRLDVPSIRDLAAWAGAPIEMEGTGLGPLKIAGRLALKGAAVSFSNAEIALDDIKATGGFIFVSAAIPEIKGRLDVERLDLNPYIPPKKGAGPAGQQAPAQGGAGGAAAPKEWSDEPIDHSALKSANADLTFTAQEIIFDKIKVGRSAVHLVLKGGRLVVDLTELALYNGAGKARIVLDGSGSTLGVEQTLELAGIKAEPFLTDAAGFDRLEGTANAHVAVKGRGNSERQIVSSLNGNGDVRFDDGAIKGMNLAQMVRSVSIEALSQGFGGAQKTDFTELSGTFVITNGILDNRDLLMKSPLLRVAGAGTSDLPKRTVDYRVEPKVVASLEGQGATDKSGIVFPVVVKGSWDDPQWSLELFNPRQLSPEGIAGAAQQLKGTVESIKKGGVKGVLPGLLGGQQAPAQEQPAQQQPEQPAVDPKDPVGTIKKLIPGLR